MYKIEKLLLFVFFLLVSFSVNAQNNFIEYTFQPSTAGSTTHATAVTNGWMIPFNADDCRPSKIAYINKSKNVQFIDSESAVSINDIIQITSNEFICAGFYGLGFVDQTKMAAVIYKMDSTGKIIWKTMFENVPYKGGFIKVVHSNDGSLYGLTSFGSLAKIDSNGKKMWIKSNLGSDILMTNRGLLACEGTFIWLLDTGGNVENYYLIPRYNFEFLEGLSNNRICAIGNGFAFLLDSNFNVTDSAFHIFHPGYVANNATVVYKDSAFYFYDTDSIISVSLKGKINWKYGLPSGYTINGLTFNENQIAVTGNGSAYNLSTPFIKTFDLNGNSDIINRDIGITKVKVGHITSQHSINVPDSIDVRDVIGDVAITVKNYGTENINSLKLESVGSHSAYYFACEENNIFNFSNLNLTSGTDTTLHVTITRFNMSLNNNSKYFFEVYINTTSPNEKMDEITKNDTLDFVFEVTGINEYILSDQNANIYPNPTNGKIYLKTSSKKVIESVSISDIAGSEIISYKNISPNFEMNISNLPSGLYFVKLHNNIGTYMQKIVKE